MTMSRYLPPQRGFTLIEAIVVITITAIISGVVATFIRTPVQGYFDSKRRAELTDAADTSVRRISRDLHLALPNSVRVAGNNLAIEFLSTRTGGRYRKELGTASDDILDFTQADTSFDVLGPPITFAAGDQIVVYNLGISGADAYSGNTTANDNRRAYNGVVGTPVNNVKISSTQLLPFASPSQRFQVVDTPVSYVCAGVGIDASGNGTGTLTRYWNYPISPSQPTSFTAGASAILAKNVSACSFIYDPQVITQRAGLVSATLQLTQSDESVNLYYEIHVSNAP